MFHLRLEKKAVGLLNVSGRCCSAEKEAVCYSVPSEEKKPVTPPPPPVASVPPVSLPPPSGQPRNKRHRHRADRGEQQQRGEQAPQSRTDQQRGQRRQVSGEQSGQRGAPKQVSRGPHAPRQELSVVIPGAAHSIGNGAMAGQKIRTGNSTCRTHENRTAV